MNKSLKLSISACRRGATAIQLYIQNGRKNDRLSSVYPTRKSKRGHPHLYAHLNRLLRESGR